MVRNDFIIAQTLMVTFFTCVLFKATLEGTKLTDHCKITWKFHRLGLNTIQRVGSSHDLHSITQSGMIAGRKHTKEV